MIDIILMLWISQFILRALLTVIVYCITVTSHECHGVSNNRQFKRLFNSLRQIRYQASTLSALCEAKSTGDSRRASNAESVSISWRHHGLPPWFCPTDIVGDERNLALAICITAVNRVCCRKMVADLSISKMHACGLFQCDDVVLQAYQCKSSHYQDRTVSRPSYHNFITGISKPGKIVFILKYICKWYMFNKSFAQCFVVRKIFMAAVSKVRKALSANILVVLYCIFDNTITWGRHLT